MNWKNLKLYANYFVHKLINLFPGASLWSLVAPPLTDTSMKHNDKLPTTLNSQSRKLVVPAFTGISMATILLWQNYFNIDNSQHSTHGEMHLFTVYLLWWTTAVVPGVSTATIVQWQIYFTITLNSPNSASIHRVPMTVGGPSFCWYTVLPWQQNAMI